MSDRCDKCGQVANPDGGCACNIQRQHNPINFIDARERISSLEQELAIVEKERDGLVDERDDLWQSLGQAYYVVVGHSPEWSNLFGKQHATIEIEETVNLLKAATKEAQQERDQLKQERDSLLALTGVGHCEKHQAEKHGARNCQLCAVEKLSHALSRISYLCGEPNEMRQSEYDTHYNEDEVVKQAQKLKQERDEMMEDAKVMVEALQLLGPNDQTVIYMPETWKAALATPLAKRILEQQEGEKK